MTHVALKWSTTQKFHHYQVYGANLEVYADNNPLTYMLTTAKLDAIGHCWLAEIVNYNFKSNIAVAIKMQIQMHYQGYRKVGQLQQYFHTLSNLSVRKSHMNSIIHLCLLDLLQNLRKQR